jgi:hypothetical protein
VSLSIDWRSSQAKFGTNIQKVAVVFFKKTFLLGGAMKVGDDDFNEAVDVVLGILHGVATRGENDPAGTITYMQLSERLRAEHGIDVPHYMGPLPHILGEASKREDENGRGMISVLVVEQGTRMPSSGFYRIARESPFNRRGDDTQIWLDESRRVRAEHGHPQV